MKYFLAVDIGASSGRHILGYVENNKLVTEEIYRFVNDAVKTVADGKIRYKWDIEHLFEEIVNGLKVAKKLGKIPVSVGIDTWGVDYVLLDEKDEPLKGAYCYRDIRTELTIPKVHEIIPFEELYDRTGIQFASFNTIYQIYDDKLSGRINNAKRLLLLPDYFHFRLSGVKVNEYTEASTTGMLNKDTRDWDDVILDRLGISKDLFSKPVMPGTEIGHFTDEIAEMVGYDAKVIIPATHDTASAVMAAPLREQSPYISSGTWSLLGIEEERAHADAKARENGYSNEGGFGPRTLLLNNIMGLWIIQQYRHELGDRYSFAELVERAESSENDMLFDVNNQKFMAPESMTKVIEEEIGEGHSIGEIAFAVYNSLAHSYAQSIKALEEIVGRSFDTLNIIGGGSKNLLLNRLTAKATGLKVITGPAEGTAIGNLLAQMIGLGDLKDVAEGRLLVANSFEVEEF